MNYQPNIDAAEYFADEILPLVQSMHQAQAAFVGRSPAPELVARQKRDRSLIFTGAVDDVRPYVAQADIFIVPLRHGSGTRLKILEAMSQGIPVVTTTIGCEGLDVRHGEHVWIADTPEAFRDGIVTLMRNPAGAANMVARARALVEQKYTWTEIARQLEADLYRIVPAQAGILA
jgi:glycosyltransferase involved in cell wall biosynthesis